MAESTLWGWTTDGTGDGTLTGYTMSQYIAWMRLLNTPTPATMGVAYGVDNALAVTVAGGARTLTIDTGGAVVYGYIYYNSAAVTKTLTHPTTGTTGWRLVLRASWAAQTVRITLLESADGTAAAPDVTHTDGVTWDISLATGTITTGDVVTATDARTFLSGSWYLAATAAARAKIAAGFFDAATVLDKFAESSLTEANLRWLIGANQVTNAVLLDLVVDGAFADSAATRALFADGIWTATQIANRTRTLFVPATGMYVAGATWMYRDSSVGWEMDDGVISTAYGEFYVPSDYASGMTIVAVLQAGSAGDCYCTHTAYYAAVGEGWNAANTASAASAVAVGNDVLAAIKSLSMASVAAGDYVTCTFQREGNSASDTVTDYVYFKGWLVSYTADM